MLARGELPEMLGLGMLLVPRVFCKWGKRKGKQEVR
jgi:hypothetical protein